jgi:SAM-dependent methyltransferase
MYSSSSHSNSNCPVCHSDKSKLRYRFDWGKVVQCARCTCAFTEECDVERANNDAFHNGQNEGGAELYRQWARERFSALQKFVGEGTLLEYGPGTGELLRVAAEAGFRATGVDRFPHLLPENRHAHVSLLESDALSFVAAQPFDAVAAVHVLEHFQKPYDFLAAVKTNLKDSGWLLVEVPNYASLSRVMSGRRWNCLVDYHAVQFTPDSLSTLMQRARFKVLSLESVGCSTTQLVGLGLPFIGRRLGFSVSYGWEPNGSFRRFATMVEKKLDWGSNLRLVARKS